MPRTFSLEVDLPPAAAGAVDIVRTLTDSGHTALLAGGCVRDLLLGQAPLDYDVATDAPPERVCRLFRATRKVGVQFGVVLVRKRRKWIEVATFRAEGEYADGRHPDQVRYTDAEEDARRRDFTVNGMFLDPLTRTVHDYVGGQVDLAVRRIRAIGDPAARFAEDHLRLLRAVRFAARLRFEIEADTRAAVCEHAEKLSRVAPERVREELARMLGHASRTEAFRLLCEVRLLPYLWPDAAWSEGQRARAEHALRQLATEAPWELAFAALVADRDPDEIERICRALTFSNEQRQTVHWLVAHAADLDQPNDVSRSALKRLMAEPAFPLLRQWAEARYEDRAAKDDLTRDLDRRIAEIPPESIAPAPLVSGDDLAARGVAPGPIYGRILDVLYTRQLEEEFETHDEALAALDTLLAREDSRSQS